MVNLLDAARVIIWSAQLSRLTSATTFKGGAIFSGARVCDPQRLGQEERSCQADDGWKIHAAAAHRAALRRMAAAANVRTDSPLPAGDSNADGGGQGGFLATAAAA